MNKVVAELKEKTLTLSVGEHSVSCLVDDFAPNIDIIYETLLEKVAGFNMFDVLSATMKLALDGIADVHS